MNANRLFRTLVIFAVLASAGVVLMVLPQYSTETVVRSALPLVGVALFASGLTFFLLEMSRANPER